MKVKIKGLVFVGFAAAILSANAMAEATNANTVTSKAYTEATYQHKSQGASIGNSTGTWTALDTELTASGETDNTAPSSKAVVDYVDGLNLGTTYQDRSVAADENKVADGNGGWKALNSDIGDTAAAAQDFDGDNGATSDAIRTFVGDEINGALDSGLVDGTYVEAVYDSTNHNTTVDLKSAQITTDGTSGLSTSSTKLVQEKAVAEAVTHALDSRIGDSSYVDSTYNSSTGVTTVSLTNVTAAYDGTNWNTNGYSDNLTTEAAVAGAISAAMGNNTLPTMPTACITDATAHCALITSSNGTTVTMEWVPTAQAQ